MDWQNAIEIMEPYVVKIHTPDSAGTGFLISLAKTNKLCGIATAAHVVHHSHYWEEPIRKEHTGTQKTVLLRNAERAIFVEEKYDTAAVVFDRSDIVFPDKPLHLIPEGKILKLGNEVGWLGFPQIAANNLCFFTGRASTRLGPEKAYFVDGVAINGVSGGPAFSIIGEEIYVIGVVSAYIPNRTPSGALPGLCVIRDVTQFQKLIKDFKTMDEAKEKESTAPPSPPQGVGEPTKRL